LTGAKLGRQFRTADDRGCRFALVRGPEEREAGLVTVKDLDSGDQQQIALDAVASHLHSALCSS
ncbi:MAG TPA: His/Gly/Thr/Pro-type tRNA ligase C-terminal domain-containing protein, partial [Alphaproteobacteria bacterium]|nr:His/Gly/Thr/Pro-type tRNA ligase C-terminal domain-containing protein [Alphaproteobacteria bacterium]